MAQRDLCSPCQKLLSGDVVFLSADPQSPGLRQEDWFFHHPDAASLQRAIEQSCPICSLGYRKWRNISDGTRGRLRPMQRDSADIFGLNLHEMTDNWKTFESDIAFELHKGSCEALEKRPPSPKDFLLERYQECKANHVGCDIYKPQGAIAPSRLIDVAYARGKVRLCDTLDLRDTSYACLSYCWGNSQPLQLTKHSEPVLRRGVNYANFPRTFREAIRVTLSLGLQYLWIDALCIFQDRKSDWSTESQKMRLIYSQSSCTIAAAYGTNSKAGLIRQNRGVFQPHYLEFSGVPSSLNPNHRWPEPGTYWCESWNPYKDNVEMSPLAFRAWVCQERQLSPRIIYFTERGPFWECYEQRTCQNYANGLPNWAHPSWIHDSAKLKRTLHSARTRTSAKHREHMFGHASEVREYFNFDIYSDWCRFRMAFSRCSLSVPSDKLVAIQGIAEQTGVSLGDRLIAGLWHTRLLTDLCWSYIVYVPGSENVTWRAPSWSWAKWDSWTWPSVLYEYHGKCSGRKNQSKLQEVTVQGKPDGRLESGSLRMQCNLIHALIKPAQPDPLVGDYIWTLQLGRNQKQVFITNSVASEHSKFSVWLDKTDLFKERSVDLVVLQQCLDHAETDSCDNPLNENQGHSMTEHSMVEGVVLAQLSEHEHVYERIGLFNVSSAERIRNVLDEAETVESTVITII